MRDHDFHSFPEFWPYYLREHSKSGTRALHFAGTTLVVATAAAALIARRPSLLLGAPVVGYGLAWIGHFFVEHNRPATFKHPLWSLQGDFKMWAMTIAGTLDAELERVAESNGVHSEGGAGPGVESVEAAPDPQTLN
jgi:hypothetical protein